jgi:hypothetical protein
MSGPVEEKADQAHQAPSADTERDGHRHPDRGPDRPWLPNRDTVGDHHRQADGHLDRNGNGHGHGHGNNGLTLPDGDGADHDDDDGDTHVQSVADSHRNYERAADRCSLASSP